jgi:tetratricopeptide (TPR) repeat protein
MLSRLLAALLVTAALVTAGNGADAMMSNDGAKSRAYLDGERAVKAKEYAKAIPLLERAVNENPRDADSYNLLGYSNRKLGNTQNALIYYQRALQYDANHKGANEYLGELYVEMNDLPKAEERLVKLGQLCQMNCEEYRDLKAAIDKAKAAPAAAPRTGS